MRYSTVLVSEEFKLFTIKQLFITFAILQHAVKYKKNQIPTNRDYQTRAFLDKKPQKCITNFS